VTEGAPIRETIYVVYVPYLPLSLRVKVGIWELIPRSDLRDDDASDAHDASLARGLAELFALPAGTFGPVGALGGSSIARFA
jgi:hypothetical protein